MVGTGRWWGAGPAAAGGTWSGLVRTGWADSNIPEKKPDLRKGKSGNAYRDFPVDQWRLGLQTREVWLEVAIPRQQCVMAMSQELRTQDGWWRRLLSTWTLMPGWWFFKMSSRQLQAFCSWNGTTHQAAAELQRFLLLLMLSVFCWRPATAS